MSLVLLVGATEVDVHHLLLLTDAPPVFVLRLGGDVGLDRLPSLEVFDLLVVAPALRLLVQAAFGNGCRNGFHVSESLLDFCGFACFTGSARVSLRVL
ncbi:Peroxidase 1 [Hordeum vulgare]|nr:Peroxidase 1 [Hordeum vulgare]